MSTPIDISKLRKELAFVYYKSGEFEINYPGDSMEALIAILNSIHKSEIFSKSDSSNLNCSPKCPAHHAFELVVEETVKCQCGAEMKNIWDYSTFSHQFYVNEIFEDLADFDPKVLLLISESDDFSCMESSSLMKCEGRLCEYLRMQWENTILQVCPRECQEPMSKKRLKLLSHPKVYMISMTWKDFRPEPLKILQVHASIPLSISLDMIYDAAKPSTHVLKSIIYYGAGHYICAIRVSPSKNWFKIDDETSKIIGNGTWKDLLIDSVKSRFYPVGLFYEKSLHREEHQLSPQEIMEIERKVIEESEITEEENDWTCECGFQNHHTWKVCGKCSVIRADVKGWACEKCTFINGLESFLCKSCGIGTHYQRKTMKKEKVEVKLNRKKCKICEEMVEISCNKCFLGYECKVCKEYIPKRDGIICVKCKSQTVNKECISCEFLVHGLNYICSNCTKELWQCKKCSFFNYPDAENCSTIACIGRKSEEFICKVIEVEPIKNQELEKKCICCGETCKENFSFCLNCKLKTTEKTCRFCRAKPQKNLCESCIYSTKCCQKCKKHSLLTSTFCPDCDI